MITTVVIDDHPIVRAGLRAVLEAALLAIRRGWAPDPGKDAGGER